MKRKVMTGAWLTTVKPSRQMKAGLWAALVTQLESPGFAHPSLASDIAEVRVCNKPLKLSMVLYAHCQRVDMVLQGVAATEQHLAHLRDASRQYAYAGGYFGLRSD